MTRFFSYCLIGALTAKPYAFSVRSWELERYESVDFFDIMGSNIYVEVRGNAVIRILPKISDFVNGDWITDKIRFSSDSLKIQRLVQPLIYNNKDKKYAVSSWLSLLFLVKSFYTLSSFAYDLKTQVLKTNASTVIDASEDTDFSSISKMVGFRRFLDLSFVSSSKKESSFFDVDSLSAFYSFSNKTSTDFLLNFKNVLLCMCNIRFEMPLLANNIINRAKKNSLNLFLFNSYPMLNCSFKNIGSSFKDLRNVMLFRSKGFTKDNTFVFIGHYASLRSDFYSIKKLFDVVSNFMKLMNISFSYKILNLRVVDLVQDYFGLANNFKNTFFSVNTTNYKQISNFNSDLNSINLEIMPKLFFASNSNGSLLNSKFDLVFYQGHHGGSFLENNVADYVLPTTAVFERDNLFLNFFGKFASSSFVVSPIQNVRNDFAFLDTFYSILNNSRRDINDALLSFSFFLNKNDFHVDFIFFISFKHEINSKNLYYDASFYNCKELQFFYNLLNPQLNSVFRLNTASFVGYLFNYFMVDSYSKASKNLSLAYRRLGLASYNSYK